MLRIFLHFLSFKLHISGSCDFRFLNKDASLLVAVFMDFAISYKNCKPLVKPKGVSDIQII